MPITHEIRQIAWSIDRQVTFSLKKGEDGLAIFDKTIFLLPRFLQLHGACTTQEFRALLSRNDGLMAYYAIVEHLNANKDLTKEPAPLKLTPDLDGLLVSAKNIESIMYERTANWLLDLLKQGAEPRVIDLLVFEGALRAYLWSQDLSHPWKRWSKRLGKMREGAIKTLEHTLFDLEEQPPVASTRALGGGPFLKIKELIQNPEPLDTEERTNRAQISQQVISDLQARLLALSPNGMLVFEVLLYYWSRISTLISDVADEHFERLEEHWPLVVAEMEQYLLEHTGQIP